MFASQRGAGWHLKCQRQYRAAARRSCRYGYHTASTAAREAPTAPPRTSANSSTAVKSPPVPRPPDMTTAASVSSGRPLDFLGSELTMRAVFAASEIVTWICSVAGSVGAASGVTAFGLTVTIGAPCVTDAITVQFPAKTDWVVVPSVTMSVASVIKPDPSLTASRPAISLPSGVEVSKIATG